MPFNLDIMYLSATIIFMKMFYVFFLVFFFFIDMCYKWNPYKVMDNMESKKKKSHCMLFLMTLKVIIIKNKILVKTF